MRVAAVCLVLGLCGRAQAKSPLQDLSPRMRERVGCSLAAALRYGIPANVVLAVAEMEGGHPGQRVQNKNGTHDVGPMQFNSRYLAHLQERYGITAEQAGAAGCYPYQLAAWRLRKHLTQDEGDIWTRAANYHSRTLQHNEKYRAKLVRLAGKWGRWLKERFETVSPAAPPSSLSNRKTVTAAAAASPTGTPGKGEDRSLQQSLKLLSIDLGVGVDAEQGDESLQASLQLLDSYGPRSVAAVQSHSVGSAHAGTLLSGVQLLEHPRFRIRDSRRAWATATTIEWLVQAFDALPEGPQVVVHDLSARSGGPLRGHKSHQSGRDADITYFQRNCAGICPLRVIGPDELDAVRQWRLLKPWLEQGQAEFVFVDYSLQGPLYEAASGDGTAPEQLRRWFQFPNGPEHPGGIIRHVPNHADHVHVRFACPAGDGMCRPTRTRARRPRGSFADGELLELLEDETEGQHVQDLLDQQ